MALTALSSYLSGRKRLNMTQVNVCASGAAPSCMLLAVEGSDGKAAKADEQVFSSIEESSRGKTEIEQFRQDFGERGPDIRVAGTWPFQA